LRTKSFLYHGIQVVDRLFLAMGVIILLHLLLVLSLAPLQAHAAMDETANAFMDKEQQLAVIRLALQIFYEAHAPDKLAKIEGALVQFAGRELELVEKVCRSHLINLPLTIFSCTAGE
jgi:hypothetical protein